MPPRFLQPLTLWLCLTVALSTSASWSFSLSCVQAVPFGWALIAMRRQPQPHALWVSAGAAFGLALFSSDTLLIELARASFAPARYGSGFECFSGWHPELVRSCLMVALAATLVGVTGSRSRTTKSHSLRLVFSLVALGVAWPGSVMVAWPGLDYLCELARHPHPYVGIGHPLFGGVLAWVLTIGAIYYTLRSRTAGLLLALAAAGLFVVPLWGFCQEIQHTQSCSWMGYAYGASGSVLTIIALVLAAAPFVPALLTHPLTDADHLKT